MPFYAKYVLGASTDETGYLLGAAFVAAIPGLAIWTALAKRFGAWRAWRWACVTFGLSLVPLLLISSVNAAYLFMVLIGLSLAGQLMLSNLLISDAVDADEVDTRTRRAGMYFGINGFLIRFAFSLQGLALGLVLSVSGYVQPAAPTDVPAQPAAALWGMRILIAVLPMLAMAIAYWAISHYPLHGENLTVLKQCRRTRAAREWRQQVRGWKAGKDPRRSVCGRWRRRCAITGSTCTACRAGSG
jgi:GPH family glycoside/pentoside/hexuronide:cation symporter